MWAATAAVMAFRPASMPVAPGLATGFVLPLPCRVLARLGAFRFPGARPRSLLPGGPADHHASAYSPDDELSQEISQKRPSQTLR